MHVFLADEQDEPLGTEPLRRLAESVLEEEGLPDGTEVAVLLVGEVEIATYNQRFLGREGPTDVLAFPLEHLVPGQEFRPSAAGAPMSLGDVVIAPAYVRRQAVDAGIDFDDEMALMVVHGLLHLLGYDHVVDEDAERMERRERELLARRVRP